MRRFAPPGGRGLYHPGMPSPPPEPVRIVLVDDDLTSLRVIESMLARDGADVRTFSDPRAAYDDMVRLPPDVLVSDWVMAGMDGPDLLKRVRATPSLQGTYCVLVTAHDDHGKKVAGLLVGADDYLIKPVSELELQARVRVGVRVRRLERQAMLLAMAVTLGHEINNPLTAVLGYLDLLKTQIAAGKQEKAGESIARIEEAAERIRTVVAGFLSEGAPRLKEYLPGTRMLDFGPPRSP